MFHKYIYILYHKYNIFHKYYSLNIHNIIIMKLRNFLSNFAFNKIKNLKYLRKENYNILLKLTLK